MGALSHGFFNPKINDNGEMIPLIYNGEELKIDYTVNASGKAKNIGFLIFIDGLPQPYKINEEESYEYLHVLDLVEDNKDIPLSFMFTPITEKKGDTFRISITSVYNPAFIPDMKETSNYGGYHLTLEVVSSLAFQLMRICIIHIQNLHQHYSKLNCKFNLYLINHCINIYF